MKVVSRVASISDKRLRRLKKSSLFFSIFNSMPNGNNGHAKNEVMGYAWAPVVITIAILILIGICCCFLRIDPSTPHMYEIETERRMPKQVTDRDIELNTDDSRYILLYFTQLFTQ